MSKPKIVIFFNDWELSPSGINAGGGETATLALAREFKSQGHTVIACGNIRQGDCELDGIQFWNFGKDYRILEITERIKDIGKFYCICTTIVHPLLAIRNLDNCLAKILITHAPSAMSSGLEPDTVVEIADRLVCVSEAQRNLILNRCSKPEKTIVIKNGFDSNLFKYQGPENRDFKKLLFVGRIEPAKGIDLLVQAYAGLIQKHSGLSLDIYGDESYWPEYVSKKRIIEETLSGLKFHGKVTQPQIATAYCQAGILVFPSIRFESAGLAVLEAQATGCPVLAFDVGGVKEYLNDETCGLLLTEKTAQALFDKLDYLISNQNILVQMSINAERYGRELSWSKTAEELVIVFKEISGKIEALQ